MVNFPNVVRNLLLPLILLGMFTISFVPVTVQSSNLPKIDGIVSPGEWSQGTETNIRMISGIDISYTTLYSSTDMYFLAKVPQNKPDDVINTNVTSGKHDFFGIEFDNNGDSVIMGSRSSPDDMVLVDYTQQGAIDLYSYSYKVYPDTSNNGVENTKGASSGVNGTIIYEIMKPLDSGDKAGYDVALKPGDTYSVMIAFWDNQFSHSAAAYTNVEVGGHPFITFTVGETAQPLQKEIIASIFFGLSVIAYFGVELFRKKFTI